MMVLSLLFIMLEEKLNLLIENMKQIEKFFCDNCGNLKCTTEMMSECNLAFAVLAKNTSWGFVLDELPEGDTITSKPVIDKKKVPVNEKVYKLY